MLPAYATFDYVDVGEQIWYPHYTAASHMIRDNGKLLTKSTYSWPSLVKVRNGTLLPIKHVNHSIIPASAKPLHLCSSCEAIASL